MQGRALSLSIACALALTIGVIASPSDARTASEGRSFETPASSLEPISGCRVAVQPASSPTPFLTASRSKSAALLGGSMSQLDRIRKQQSIGANQTLAQGENFRNPELPEMQPPQPALGRADMPWRNCNAPSASLAIAREEGPNRLDRDSYSSSDFLASKRILVGHTVFDKEWNRVRDEGISRKQLLFYLGNPKASRFDLLAQVNRWANHHIAYVEDKDLFGQADYWAGAPTTLALRKGDCEDIALVKMQMLAAAGVRREDMFLTIARDLARNADHAVLIVRTKNGFFLLDNSTDKPLNASDSYFYRPIVSFNERTAWIHGFSARRTTLAFSVPS